MFSITAFSPGILVLFLIQRNDVPNIFLKDDRRSPHPCGGDFLEKKEEVSFEEEGSDHCDSSFEELVSSLACGPSPNVDPSGDSTFVVSTVGGTEEEVPSGTGDTGVGDAEGVEILSGIGLAVTVLTGATGRGLEGVASVTKRWF